MSYTIPSADVTAPTFSGENCSATDTTITCTWNTNELATTQMCRGATGGPYNTCTTEDVALSLSHSATFTGLTASTTYFWVLKGTDSSGNAGTSTPEETIATDASGGGAAPTTPPGSVSSSSIIAPHYSGTQPKTVFSVGATGLVGNGTSCTATVSSGNPSTNPQFLAAYTATTAGMSDSAGNVAAGVITSVTSTTVVFNCTFNGTTGSGTVTPDIRAVPSQGSSYTDVLNSNSVVRFWNRTNSPTSGSGTHHHYASRSPFNKPNGSGVPTYALLRSENDGYFVVDMTSYPTMTVKCDPSGTGNSIDAMWSRTDSDYFFFKSSNALKKQLISTCATGTTTGQSTLKTFSEYSSIQLGGDEGDISLNGQYIPIIGLRTSDSQYELFCYDWNADTKKSVFNPPTTSNIIDHNYCWSDGTQFIRYGVHGKGVSSISRTSNVITVTVSSAFTLTPSVGNKVRIMRGQRKSATAATLNGLWTVCGPPDAGCSTPTSTVLTLTSSGGDVASISGAANGWEVGTQYDGMIYVTDSSGTGVFNNNFSAQGNHNARGVMTSGTKVVVRESNSQGFSPCGSGSTGWSKLYVAAADWPANGANDEAQGTCLANFGSGMGNSHIGAEGKWAIFSQFDNSLIAEEASLSSSWNSSWRKWANEIIIADLDTDALYRMVQHRARNTTYFCNPRAALSMSADGGTELPMFLMFDSTMGGNCTSSGTVGADPYVVRMWQP